jgi:hypothetical protein
MSETQVTFEGILDNLLERFSETVKKSGCDEPTLSKEQLIGIYNAAASLTVAQEIEYAVMKITGQ